MPDHGYHDVTRLLHEWREGDSEATEKLFPLVYEELRHRARRCLSGEARGHTLQATALVHEAYLKLTGGSAFEVADRVHFYAVASNAMRQILVDHARRRDAQKRGGANRTISLSEPATLAISAAGSSGLIDLDDALKELEKIDHRKSDVVDMRFFGGLSNAEIAIALGVTERTVERDWKFARMFLYRELANGS